MTIQFPELVLPEASRLSNDIVLRPMFYFNESLKNLHQVDDLLFNGGPAPLFISNKGHKQLNNVQKNEGAV